MSVTYGSTYVGPGAFSRRPCIPCGCETFHKGMTCVHCLTVTVPDRERQAQLDRLNVLKVQPLQRKGGPGKPKNPAPQPSAPAPQAEPQVSAIDRPCFACKTAERESGPYCKPCRKAYNARYIQAHPRKVPA